MLLIDWYVCPAKSIMARKRSLTTDSLRHWKNCGVYKGPIRSRREWLSRGVHPYNCIHSEAASYSCYFLLFWQMAQAPPIDSLCNLGVSEKHEGNEAYLTNWQRRMREAYFIASHTATKQAVKDALWHENIRSWVATWRQCPSQKFASTWRTWQTVVRWQGAHCHPDKTSSLPCLQGHSWKWKKQQGSALS